MIHLLVLLLKLFWLQSLANVEDRARHIQLFGRPKPLNTRDRLNTRFSLIGTHLGSKDDLVIYSSIASGEECVLRRFNEVTERCEDIERPICSKGMKSVIKYLILMSFSLNRTRSKAQTCD